MGCHTWFYKPIKIEYEIAKKQFLELSTETIVALKAGYTLNCEYSAEQLINIYSRQQRMVEKGLCKVAVMNKYEHQDKVTLYIPEKNTHYVNVDNYHNIFRIGNYPIDKLFSYNETIQFIESNKDKVYSHLGWIDEKNTFGKYDEMINIWEIKLQSFWDKYPDGMIDFG